MLRFLALLPLLCLSSTAFAQDEEEPAPSKRSYRYQAQTLLEFDELDVDAAVLKPGLIPVWERKRGSFNPLIKLRSEFSAELDGSVDEIK